MTLRSLRLSKFIFYALIICLPINLGLHLILPSAYVGGLLIDYLIPTLFIQDILVVMLCASWVIEDPRKVLQTLRSKKSLPIILLVYILFLSTLLASRFVPSFYMFIRWELYAFASLYVRENFDRDRDYRFISKVLSYWIIFLGILALGQYLKQGSVFNNYLFLGEQPYSAATALIDRENVFGSARVPAYGIFRHPNIFGGFLAISLIWVTHAFKKKLISTKLFLIAFLYGVLGLFLTFSFFSWTAFLLGLILILSEEKKYIKTITISLFIFGSLCGLAINRIPFPDYLLENPSVYKRIDLLVAGYRATSAEKYIFGSGINSSTVIIEKFLEPNNFLRFVQPPHNVFVLLASEIGVVGLLAFLIILFTAIVTAKKNNFLIFTVLLQVLFLSSFDHYFVTVHQTFLLLWLLVGLAS